jgi:tetratricopeptide (TPR) repeat protein
METRSPDVHEKAGRERSDLLGEAAYAILSKLLPDSGLRLEHLGEAFLACERVAHERPQEFQAARETDQLEAFLTPFVRGSIRGNGSEGPHGGWLGTFLGPDGRPIENPEPENTDLDALATSRRALRKAFSIAAEDGNQTMLRNLRWYCNRLSEKTTAAIAEVEGKPPATIRTGVARAKKFVLQIVHDLQQAQPAPVNGEAPAQIEPLRRLWMEQDLEGLARELERTRERFSENPHWLNLAALLAADRGRVADAMGLYEKALVFADVPAVRGRILNNLGNLAEDQGRLDEAQQYWLRATHLVPFAPAPLLNLLTSASVQQSYARAQHYIARLSDLLNSGKLSSEERAYLQRRLRENPNLGWLRQTRAWSLGPARWFRGNRLSSSTLRGTGAVVATLLATLLGLFVLLEPETALGAPFSFDPPSRSSREARSDRAYERPREARARRGHSTHRDRSWHRRGGTIVAGDSMPRSGGGGPRPGRPRPHR